MGLKRVATPYSYSSSVAAGDYIFLGLHRGSGADFPTQCGSVFKNVEKTLEKFNLGPAHLVKVNVWLKNIRDLPEMEKLIKSYFKEDGFPARMTSTTDLIDDDCLVMLDGVAYCK